MKRREGGEEGEVQLQEGGGGGEKEKGESYPCLYLSNNAKQHTKINA